MTFVNWSLLLGSLLTAIPIAVHLMMRREPKRQLFPAFQFLVERRKENRQRLQIRQWLLLCMRCALIALLAAALARPSADSLLFGGALRLGLGGGLLLLVLVALGLAALQRRGKFIVGGLGVAAILLLLFVSGQAYATFAGAPALGIAGQRAPVSAVLLFDTAPRMEYRYQNRSRLETAQDEALWLLKQFPQGSQVAVVETRPGPAVFAADRASAEKAIARLSSSALAQHLPASLPAALELADSGSFDRKELYVFTDLTATTWPQDELSGLADQIEQRPDIQLYLIDVGVPSPRNVGLGDLRLSAETPAANSVLTIETDVSRWGSPGADAAVAVNLHLEQPSSDRPLVVDGQVVLPDARLRGQQTVTLDSGTPSEVRFSLPDLPIGTHHGTVRLHRSDSLTADDVRYFAVDVQTPWRVLVTAPDEVVTEFFNEAVAPLEYRQTGRARFDIVEVPWSDWGGQEFSQYAAVCLLDPRPLSTAVWESLAAYVSGGGSLAVFLGHHAHPPSAFNQALAAEVLGFSPVRQWRAPAEGLFVAPAQYDHPILAPFRSQASSVPWTSAPIFRHWMLTDLADRARVVFRFSNNQPAMLENQYGAGRVLSLTTPVSDPLRPAGRQTWNELPTTDTAWPYVVLVNESLLYLVRYENRRLNYRSGEPVVLENPQAEYPQRYQVFPPSGPPTDIVARQNTVTIRFTEQPGAYRLKGFRGEAVVRGFAVNIPASQTRLDRTAWETLQPAIGGDRWRYARDRREIELEVGEGRVGREFYPFLVVMLVLVVGLEQLLANRFYPETR